MIAWRMSRLVAVLAMACVWVAGTPATAANLRAPPNDYFGTAQVLHSDPMVSPGRLFDASASPGEPLVLGRDSVRRTVWYEYTAPSTGRALIFFSSRLRNLLRPERFGLGVYVGDSMASSTLVTSKVFGDEAALAFDTVEGRSYHIQIDCGKSDEFLQDRDLWFEIGIRQVAAGAEIAMFLRRPLLIQNAENPSDEIEVFVANGTDQELTYVLRGRGLRSSSGTSKALVAAGHTVVDNVAGMPNAHLPIGTTYVANLVMESRSREGRRYPNTSLPFTFIRQSPEENDDLVVHFAPSLLTGRVDATLTTTAYVKSGDGRPHKGCRFVAEWSRFSYAESRIDRLAAREIRGGKPVGPVNPVISLGARDVRTFQVEMTPSDPDETYVTFLCADGWFWKEGRVSSAAFKPLTFRERGFPKLVMEPDAANAFGEVRAPSNAEVRVPVTVSNLGIAAQYRITWSPWVTGPGKVTGVCILDTADRCSAAPAEFVTLKMGPGEKARVALILWSPPASKEFDVLLEAYRTPVLSRSNSKMWLAEAGIYVVAE